MQTVPSYPISPAEAASRKLFTELQPDDRIEATHEVKVGLQRWTAKTIGAVVRCEGDLIAIHFTDTLKNGELDPPEELLAIYHALEQEWLKSRLV